MRATDHAPTGVTVCDRKNDRTAAMTQIVTVSAATAAYATEGLKPSARISGAMQTQETTQAQVLEARRADTLRHDQMNSIVGPPAIALFFLTAGERGRLMQQTTLREAEDAYFLNEADVEEASGKQSEDEHAEDSEGNDDPGEEFDQQQAEVLALPAPETYS
jgi:hypothetical protein